MRILLCELCGMVTTIGGPFPSQCPKGAHRHKHVQIPVLPQQVAEGLAEAAERFLRAEYPRGRQQAAHYEADRPALELFDALNTYHAAIGRNDES